MAINRDFANKDREASIDIRTRIAAKPNDCFANACRAIRTLPELANATYVEGMIVVFQTGGTFEHGWIFHDDKIIDPTLPEYSIWYLPSIELKGSTAIREFIESNEGFTEPPFYKAPQFKARFSKCRKKSVEFSEKQIHEVLKDKAISRQVMNEVWEEMWRSFPQNVDDES